jgi:hypothetical protein
MMIGWGNLISTRLIQWSSISSESGFGGDCRRVGC